MEEKEQERGREGGNDQCIIFNFPANNSPWSVVGLLVHLEIFRCVRVFLAAFYLCGLPVFVFLIT